MTREEAVARIKDHIEIHRYHERNAVKIFEALDMAIQALEQPEPCEDAVSRQVATDTLLKWMRPICINNNGEVVESDDMVTIRNILKSLPPAQSERKTGKWITQMFGSWAECSECHELYDIPISLSNFCPNCGADMRGDEDEID